MSITENTESKAKLIKGVVTSDSMNKTVVVSIHRKVNHPIYQKKIKRTTKIMAHDEENKCKKGDSVFIKQSRPISRHKSFVVESVLEKDRGF
jgi:small subunit ribosomal protein S17